MPKLKAETPKEVIFGRIPADLAAKVRLLLLNPRKGKVRYGSINHLLIHLLEEWVNRVTSEYQQESKGSPYHDTSS